MKTAILAIASVFTFFAAAPAFAQVNPGDNLPAPGTSMKNANGKTVVLKDAAGKNGLLVMFSCNTCPYVVKNEPIIKKVMEYAASQGVGMIIINSNEAKRGGDDSYEAMAKYAKAQQYTVPYVLDENSKLADLFGANHTPEMFLFDKNNKLVYKGAMNDNPSNPNEYKRMYAEEAINAMVAGKPADPQTTKSIGCSIKRKV